MEWRIHLNLFMECKFCKLNNFYPQTNAPSPMDNFSNGIYRIDNCHPLKPTNENQVNTINSASEEPNKIFNQRPYRQVQYNYQLSTAVMVQLSDIQNSEIYSFYFLSLKFNKHSFFASILLPRKNHFEIKNDAETCRDKLLQQV